MLGVLSLRAGQVQHRKESDRETAGHGDCLDINRSGADRIEPDLLSSSSSSWCVHLVGYSVALSFQSNAGAEGRNKMCCCDGDCRPIGWLLGLPFALLAVIVSFVGAIIWIIGCVPACLPVPGRGSFPSSSCSSLLRFFSRFLDTD